MGKYFKMKTFIAIIALTLALSSIIAKRNVVKDTAALNTAATAFPNAQIKNDTAQRAHGKKPARANAKKTLTAAQRKDRDAKKAARKTKRAERKAAKIAKRKAAEKDFTPAQKKAAKAARKSARATKRAAAKGKKAAKKPARALQGRRKKSAANAPADKVEKAKKAAERREQEKAQNPLFRKGVWPSGDITPEGNALKRARALQGRRRMSAANAPADKVEKAKKAAVVARHPMNRGLGSSQKPIAKGTVKGRDDWKLQARVWKEGEMAKEMGREKMLEARVWKKGEMAEEMAREKAAEKARASARRPKNRGLGSKQESMGNAREEEEKRKKMLQAQVWKRGEMAEEIAREKAAEKARASARHPKNRRLGKLRYHLYPIEEVPAKEEAEPKAPNPLTQAGVWSSVDAMHKDIKRKFALRQGNSK